MRADIIHGDECAGRGLGVGDCVVGLHWIKFWNSAAAFRSSCSSAWERLLVVAGVWEARGSIGGVASGVDGSSSSSDSSGVEGGSGC